MAGRLRGRADAIGEDELTVIVGDIWAGNAVATSAIEGEVLDMAAVRSSVANKLGATPARVAAAPSNVEGLLHVMNDATAHWERELSEERLISWQAALFPEGRSGLRRVETGTFRTRGDPMRIVSGSAGNGNQHYRAPPSVAGRVEMRHFFALVTSTQNSGGIDRSLR